MSEYWKYVVIGDDIIVFPPTMSHSQFKNMGTITSAGLIRIYERRRMCPENKVVMCFGESKTLKIKSNPTRDERLTRGLFQESQQTIQGKHQ